MAFKLDNPKCPKCGETVAGTLERIPGRAEVAEVQPGVYEYSGGTTVFWDDQKTEKGKEGRTILLCSCGTQWGSKMEVVR